MDNLAQIFMAGLQAQAAAAAPPRNNAGDAGERDERPRRTLKERVANAYEEGLIDCNNIRHFLYANEGGRNVGGLRHASDERVLSLMVPYDTAACKCERDALRRFTWADQQIGTMQDRYIMPGASFVGCLPKPENGVYRKVCPVPYQLEHDEAVALGKLFPGYVFYSYQTGKHDHAVAHTVTMMGAALAVQSLPTGTLLEPAVCIDISGNPKSNARTNVAEPRRVIETCCKAITPKDVFRQKTKWGPEVSADGTRNWHNLYDREIGAPGASLGPERMALARALLSIHTLYYLDYAEVWRMLDRCSDDAQFVALVHKFGEGASGTVNAGEQMWGRKDGEIEQVNKLSGESYRHADTDERWFKQYNWVSGNRALSWSVNLISGDQWIVRIVKYDPAAIGQHVPAGAEQPQPEAIEPIIMPTAPVSNSPYAADVVYRDQYVPLRNGADIVRVPVARTHVDVYDYCMKSMIGKPRDAKMWKSHLARVNLRCKTIMTAKPEVRINADQMLDLAVASFWAGLEREVAVIGAGFDSYWQDSIRGANQATFGSNAAAKSLVARYVRLAATIASNKNNRFDALAHAINGEISGGHI